MKLLLAFFFVFTYSQPPVWLTDFSKAHQQSVQTSKRMLLNFSGSDWCGPCIRMKKEIFNSDAFSGYASEHLILVNADFPRLKKNQLNKEQTKQNEALADKYNMDGKFPFTILLDVDGKVLRAWDGYPDESAEAFVEEIKKLNAAN
jgi:thioredoxin-related protein